MKKANETGTDFEKLTAMQDWDIDCSDIPALSDEFLAAAKWTVETPEKEQITIRIDKSVLEFYRRMGKGYQTRMNAVLRSYAETVERRRARDQA
ncbi:MAG: BrnA antitoxin family protein [Synergistaceae bacterium]|jgi:uncharacterized protein (DUF4415 family)|nr:BrnA antitoxin family protein [Synergistaceae bacterium]